MIKNYTNKDYADKAVEANSQGKQLYILVTPTEFEREVLEFEWKETGEQQPVYNENGEQIGTEPVKIPIPIMIEKEIPIYNESGEQTGTEIIQVQSSHKETYIENVATLVIAENNYYICYKDNYTDGTINSGLEQEKVAKRQKQFQTNFITTSWGAFRKTPKGYSSAVEAVNTIFNMVNIQQGFTEQLAPLLIFYEIPNFNKEEECTDEWLISHQKTHEPCDLSTFMKWYLEFQNIWATTQYKDV